MAKTVNSLNSNAYERIASLQLSHGDRANAVYALQTGEQIAEAILAFSRFLRLFFAMPVMKPGLKH